MTGERLNSISLHQEMQRSYLEYAMSVIVGRALPDARDGLKPVQRRILFAMHELGLTPDRPFKKCARVVGDVLGKYHPHGDQAVYDALVRLVQDFSSKYPILNGHGNFGSIDDDPPAAMRYTETRLAEISQEAILKEIDLETVDFSPNFDGSQQEPNVLPAQLPFLILNGCTGIAVGMATSIPPHNLNEIVNGLLELIINPNLDEEKLIKIIPGPDFPTGGEVLLSNGINETYLKGKGSIPMRGVAHIEEVNPGKGKHKRTGIVITELPYQVNKSGWIEKLAEQVNDGKINGIADIRDESDRSGMRILIEIRRDSDPNKILKDLYRKTSLQCNYGAIMLALVNGQPIQLSLKNLLLNFLDFREKTIIRRTNNALNKILVRLEIIDGLTKALKNLKLVIATLENANDPTEAKAKLIKQLNINNKQAEGVLSMPLRKLTSIEKESLNTEQKELLIKKEKLKLILEDRKELLLLMSTELKDLKKRFGVKRKSRLIKGGDALIAEKNANQRPNKELQRKQALESIPKDSLIIIENNNKIKLINKKSLNKLKLEETIPLSKDGMTNSLIVNAKESTKILVVTNNGKLGLLRWEFTNNKYNVFHNLLPNGIEEKEIISLIPLSKNNNSSLGLITSDGRFKRIPIEDVIDISNRATSILKLKENVVVKSALLCNQNEDLLIISNYGRILKFQINEENLPLMGKLAQGPLIVNLFPDEEIINAFTSHPERNEKIALISEKGLCIKYKTAFIRNCSKGDLGWMQTSQKISFSNKDKIIYAYNTKDTINIKSNLNRVGQISNNNIKEFKEKELIKNLISLEPNELIIKVVPLIKELD
tara:strand:+ start:8223 stop:10703 length:2481 start_codon:yes stop_codon:yes gene_type:complete